MKLIPLLSISAPLGDGCVSSPVDRVGEVAAA